MNTRILTAAAALALSSCGDKEPTDADGRGDGAKTSPVSALGSSPKRPTYTPPKSRRFDPAKATPEEIAARQRLEERLAVAAVEKKKADARRAEERTQRLAQVDEQITTRLLEADANGDGLLDQAEVTGPFARRFDESDANSDGVLDSAEQATLKASIRERLSEGGGGGGRGGRGRDRGRGGGGGGRS